MPTSSLNTDPLIDRAHELVEKNFRPRGPEQASLWIHPPAAVGSPLESCYRFWQPQFEANSLLRRQGWTEVEDSSLALWPSIVVYASKHKEENWEILDSANSRLARQEDSEILFAVPNDYGAKSYQKRLEESGRLLDYETGRKSRLYRLRAVACADETDSPAPLRKMRKNEDGFWSCPGLFSWASVDRGSRMLAQTVAGYPLGGPVADLGAGWGYLGTGLDPSLPLHLFDSDRRGLEAAERNLEGRKLTTTWCDLSARESIPAKLGGNFSTVITNPPFHAGKREAAELGQLFAVRAHDLLRKGGSLFLVGNTHLAYPRLLAAIFSTAEVCVSKDGFQVIKATK